MTDIESLRRLTEAVEMAGADIAPTYLEYIQLSFAIATDCGEAGRDFFHRLCRMSPKYQREHAERVFSNALTAQRGEVHLGTVFHLAEAMGVTVSKEVVVNSRTGTRSTAGTVPQSFTHVRTDNKVNDDEMAEEGKEELLYGSEPQHPLPTFPEAGWPEFLQRIIKAGGNMIQHDIMLLGALTALGACMSRYVRCLYGGKYHHPSLQCFVVAPSASGKGILSYIRLLVEPIHDEIRTEVATQMKAYKKEKAAYDAMGKERSKMEAPQMPPNRMFLISGNNTGTGILQNIMDSDGTGLICEAEADTLSTAIGSDHGHWSDTLRKAFDHDRLSYNRRTDQEYREVKKSYLSVLISGTPSQVQTFIPTAEDGSYSRQMYYYMCGISKWISQFMDNGIDWEEIFTAMGLEWKGKLSEIKAHGIHTLQLTDEQKEEFDTVFSGLFERSSVANGREMYSFVARLAVNLCRIMSEVAVLRALESPHPYDFKTSPSSPFTPDKEIPADNCKDGIITRWDVSISQEDFHAVLSLTEALYCHATHILSFLPSTEVSHRCNADRDYLFQKLGNEFTRTQLLEEAMAMGIKENTALTWLKRLTKYGKLVSVDGKGSYARTCVYE
ncbi:hypothetical protein BOVA604_1514 [Bacteroides ovatus]|uniref:DUF3987 domain-containing protein n=1 Tax=Bacteroides ovatus TaxID=28116 RepID=UPI0020A7130C|nr:DUF3987 domain-containing protein [Bacteroides ovatus]CAG9892598.1 hypothetical protein BOVA604_1514 [Bacteroides ovatus]